MTDITKCSGMTRRIDREYEEPLVECPHRESCWRFIAPASERQAWMDGMGDFKKFCFYWMPSPES